uniref:C-type lectin domain-containing protein n=1 Tax=Nothobranchius furzeri TaxID=105023 RepID=A0A8C6Q0G7_NOTFU
MAGRLENLPAVAFNNLTMVGWQAGCCIAEEAGVWHELMTGHSRCTKMNWTDAQRRNATFYLISTTMTWFQAQSYCRQYHTDLASVRNLSENQRLMTLVQSSGAWFGLYRNNWRWSDDSTMSYTSWNKKYPAGGIRGCVAAGFKGPGGWEDWMCDAEKVFVCYSGWADWTCDLKKVFICYSGKS